MKNIGLIMKRDLKNIFTNSMAVILAVGILILPSLYAWVNIYANWDPYGKQSTGNMKVAVAIGDEGLSFRGISVNIGEEIRKNLQANDMIDWVFLSKEDAVNGVLAGDYYAAIEIPENFSESIASILSDRFEAPQITYYANEKKNAIATKITDKVVQTIQSEVNETFIKTVADVASGVLGAELYGENGERSFSAVTLADDLMLAKTGVEDLQKTLDAFDGVFTQLLAASDALPEDALKTLFADLDSSVNSTQEAIKVVRSVSEGMLTSVDLLLESSAAELSQTAELLGNADNLLSVKALTNLNTAAGIISSQQKTISRLSYAFESVNSLLPAGTGGVIDLLDTLGSAQDQLALAGQFAESSLTGSGKGSRAAELSGMLSDVAEMLSETGATYRDTVRPALNNALDSVSATLADASSIASAIMENDALTSLRQTAKSAVSVDNGVMQDLSALLAGIAGNLERLSDLILGLNDKEAVNLLQNILVANGSALGSFLASPVSVDNDTLYSVANYGSAMAPFYTTLAIWVGGIILIAIFKTDVKKKKELGNITQTQAYFGRALTFVLFALAQGLIICLGDLYLLKIQCSHPFLFVFAGAAASLVFSFFIYSVVSAFGDIGKAIVVILLVVQLGGSGGTFPIDVTPAFFRTVHPYLPFTFVINAMRECICEMWKSDYWIDLLKLLSYVIAALVIGLFIGAIFRKPIRFFSEKIEETGLL